MTLKEKVVRELVRVVQLRCLWKERLEKNPDCQVQIVEGMEKITHSIENAVLVLGVLDKGYFGILRDLEQYH